MKITVFGGSGRTGQILLGQALRAGHAVTALVRDPARVQAKGPALRVLRGSVGDAAQVEHAISGAGAVISVLGPSQNRPVYEISAATSNIVQGMQHTGVRRLVMSVGAGVRDPQDAPGAFDRFLGALVKRMVAHVYEDMRRSVEVVRAADLDWTLVRVPVLTDAPRMGRVRVGYVGRGTGQRLSRADLADFLLRQLADNTYLRQAPAISN